MTDTVNIGPDAATTAIRLRDVTMRFGGRTVLENVGLDIRRGDFIAVTGPNGGGKTTLMRIILRLLAPSDGSVEYLGPDGTPAPRLSIGYLPQKSAVDSRFPITVDEVVSLGLMGPAGRRLTDHDARVAAMIDELELTAKASAPIGSLSGGQLQRALLGRALVAEPSVLVLDEPLSYLDKHFEHKLYHMLDDIRRQRPSTAIVLVSHEMSAIAAMATRHIVVDRTIHVCHSASHLVHYDCADDSCAELH